ncbi:MAG: hypothetical protein KF893_25895 [Caldilineaceae bacterium]|nr:hypothetical protein [Caldilineaceae bacterium]
MNGIDLENLLSNVPNRRQKVSSFALLCLGIIESLAGGALSATDALHQFFHTQNCLFVRKHLQDKLADELMSRGVQLADLFDALPVEDAQREFQRELAAMHSLSLKLLEEKRIAA